MMIKQADLFWGLGKAFVKQVHDASVKETFSNGEICFKEGDRAASFYTLIKGRIQLGFGESGRTVFLIDRAGESFGWSSLVDRDTYSATALCLEPTTVLKFGRDTLSAALQEFPADGLVFMKRLAAMLGHRLLKTYQVRSSVGREEADRSYGTGQLQEAFEET